MKSGALNTFLGLDLADFGRDPQQLESRAKFCFCFYQVSNAQFY